MSYPHLKPKNIHYLLSLYLRLKIVVWKHLIMQILDLAKANTLAMLPVAHDKRVDGVMWEVHLPF